MKNVLLSIFAFALSTSASAQFVIVDDELPVLASDIDKITYEENFGVVVACLPGQ